MAEDDLRFTIQARGDSPRTAWAPVTGLPAEIKDLLWAQEQAADLLPYQLPGARRPSLGTVYVRQDVGSDIDEAPADHQPAPSLDEHGQLVEAPVAPAVVRVAVRPPSRPMRSALDNDDHLVITGGPGQGKSTLTLRLTADIVRAWSAGEEDHAPIAEPVLPLRLPARVLAAHLGLSISQTLAGSASAEYGRYLSGPLDPALFAHRVAGFRWLLLVDALDEVADSDARAEIVHTLAAWACKDPYRVILTTRPAEGGTLAPLQRAGAARYELLPFDEEALRGFAEHWFDDDDQTRTFLREIRDAHLFELVAVPLLATIAAIVFEQHGDRPLPGNRYQLYRSYLAFIESSRPTPEAFERNRAALIEHLGRTRLRSDVPLTDAVREWARCHQDVGSEEELIAYLTAVGPFVPRGGDLTFLHHSFAEHVAATAEARDLPEQFDPGHPAVAELLHRAKSRQAGRFAGSVLLHYTHLHPDQADELLDSLNKGTSEQHLLAARLLANHLPASASSIDAFLTTVRGWAMTTQFRAGLILSRASRATHHPGLADWLAELLHDDSAPWESRAEAAAALAVRLRDPRASEALVFLRAAVEDTTAHAERRLTAAEALADSGTAERDAAECGLRSVLTDPLASGVDCQGAAVVLAAFGGEAREFAVEALERLVSDQDTPVEDLVKAATGLAEIGIEFHDRCADVFLDVLRDRAHSSDGRRDAAVGLASIGRPQPAADALAAFVIDRRVAAGLRSSTASALAALGPRQRDLAGELLLSQLDAGQSERRLLPARIAGLCARETGIECLRKVLADRGAQWSHVITTASALADLGPEFHDEVAAHLELVLAHCPPSRYEYIACLRELGKLGEPHRGAAITRMRAALTDLRMPPKTRCLVAGELARCGPEHHGEITDQLLVIAGSERDPEVVSQAWLELKNLGPALSERALPELLALARGDCAAVQLANLGSVFQSSDVADRRAVADLLVTALDDDELSLHKRLQATQGLIWLGRAFHRVAVDGVRKLIRAGLILDIIYVARTFASTGHGVRAALAETFLEILDDTYADQFRAWRAVEALDVLGHDVPTAALRRIADDVFADSDDRARAAIMLARNDNAHLAEAVDLTFRACADMGQESWRGLIADLAALGADVRPKLRELTTDPDRHRHEPAAAACQLGAEALPVLRRHAEFGYLDFHSRSNAYRMLVEVNPSTRTEAIDAHLSVLHDLDQQIYLRCQAATALAVLDRTVQPAMCEVLWRFAESSHLGVGERASAAEALTKIDTPISPRLALLIVGLAHDPDLGDSRKAELARLLPRPHRTVVEEFLLSDYSVAVSDSIPRLDMWDDLPLRAEAEATVRESLAAPESGFGDRRAAATALSRLSARVDQEAVEFLLALGTTSSLGDAAKHGAQEQARDRVLQIVVDETRALRERRTAALLFEELADEPSVRTFLMEDRDQPWRVRADVLRYLRDFDELRSIRDNPAAPPAQRRHAMSYLVDLSLDDRAACARVLAEMAADPAVRPALRWRVAEDLAELGVQGRAEALPLLEAIARDEAIGVGTRRNAAAEICSLSPTRRREMLVLMRGLLPIAAPLMRVQVLYSIALWSNDVLGELRAMATDTRLGPTVRQSAAYHLVGLRADERGVCARVVREIATNGEAPRHVRRLAARRLAFWSDECRAEARALLAEL